MQAVIHGMLFAFIYLVLQKRQVLSEGKGEALFSAKISNLLLFLSVVSFIVRLFNTSQTCIDFYQYCGLDLTSFYFFNLFILVNEQNAYL